MTLLEHDPAPPTPARPSRRSLRPLLTRLHFYAGVLVGPFILVAAVTGGLYALMPQVEKVLYADELHTDSRGPALALDDQVAAARAVEPDLPLLAVRPAAEEGATTRVLLDDGRTEDSRRLAVFVDPVDGDVQGTLTAYGSSGVLPATTWLDDLHRSLHLGDPGRVYSELAASWLGVVALAGLALWWTGPRRAGRRLLPDRRARGRRRTLSWHGALGTWLVLGMLVLSATGLTWSRFAGTHVTELRTALDWTTPQVVADLAPAGDDAHAGHAGHGGASPADAELGDAPGVGYEAAYRTAVGDADLVGPVEVTGPTSSTGTYVVQELDVSWPTQADAVSVAQDGEVVDVVRFADYPFVAKLARWGIDLHMGRLFGVWSQVGMTLLAAAIATMTVLGYRMWWQRRPRRGGSPVGRPARRGTWRSVHPGVLALLAALTAVVAWALPVLGVSLLAFLLLDALLGWRHRHRRRTPA